jgi:hypothetical protein
MLVGIDGTGPVLDGPYEREFRGSFVLELTKQIEHRQPTRYYRGPNTLSIGFTRAMRGVTFSQVRDVARLAVQFILSEQGQTSSIVLAGYSRGAAACIEAARMLAASAPRLTVSCLALFDAVDRDLLSETAVIPGNVQIAYHALRQPQVGSRTYFGNTGMRHQVPGRLVTRTFRATHAAMGGLPWTGDHPASFLQCLESDPARTFAHLDLSPHNLPRCPTITEPEDRAGAAAVKTWMWGNLRKYLPLP